MGRWSKERHAQEAAKKAEQVETKAAPQPAKAVERVEPDENDPKRLRDEIMNELVKKNPRNEAMEEIIASRNPEPKEAPEPEAEPTPKAEPEAVVEQVPAAEPQADAAPAPAAPEPPKKVKVKVDGEEFEVEQSEIDEYGGIRAYQTAKAADNRLKKANEVLAEARKFQVSVPPVPQQPQMTYEQALDELEKARWGTPEEFRAAQKRVLDLQRPVDPNIIANQAITMVAMQQAAHKFKADHQDIFAVPALADWAAVLEQKMLAQLPKNVVQDPNFVRQFDWTKFYANIGNTIRGAIGRPSQPAAAQQASPSGTPSPVVAEKEARKASIVNLPTASARAEPPKEEKTPTRDDVLDEMRKRRGQKY